MKRARRQRGASLVETLVVLAVVVILLGSAASLVGAVIRARAVSEPAAKRVWTRARVLGEVCAAQSAAGQIAYFDVDATLALARGAGGGGAGTTRGVAGDGADAERAASTAGSRGNAPPGYCGPVVLNDPSTWPDGFDGRDQSTWTSVDWWSGFDRRNPATWYYRCPDPDPDPGPGTGSGARPVYSYGTGLWYGGEIIGGPRGSSVHGGVPVVGPAAVVAADSRIFTGQSGPAIVLLRTEPGQRPYALGGPFSPSSNRIRLVARDEASINQITRLAEGDELVVNGKSTTGTYATALAVLSGPAEEVAVPGPADSEGNPYLRYFEAPIRSRAMAGASGLRTSPDLAASAQIREDAAVALLARDGGAVAFYTRADGRTLVLERVVGPPSSPAASETIARDVVSEFDASIETETIDASGTTIVVPTRLRASLVVRHDEPGEAENVAVSAPFLSGGAQTRRIGVFVQTHTTLTGPPSPGIIPGDWSGRIEDGGISSSTTTP